MTLKAMDDQSAFILASVFSSPASLLAAMLSACTWARAIGRRPRFGVESSANP
jgi:hypothetical protein